MFRVGLDKIRLTKVKPTICRSSRQSRQVRNLHAPKDSRHVCIHELLFICITRNSLLIHFPPGTMNGFAPQPGLWQEASSADGRVYYYNTQTKATQWTKPLDMMTSAEVTNILLPSIASAEFCCRELLRVLLGKNTITVAASTGITLRITKQPGKCPRSLRMLRLNSLNLNLNFNFNLYTHHSHQSHLLRM
jgi:WW domain